MIPDDYLVRFTLPSIPNHVSRNVTERVPWSGTESAPPAGWKKTKVRAWHADAGTQHLYYSMYEGDAATLRLSKENPPQLLRAIIVDYDCHGLSDAVLEETLLAAEQLPNGLCPAFVSRSHSGGVHAMWLLEEPLWVGAPDLRKKLLAWFKRYLRLDRFLPGMDEKVWSDHMIYFSCGTAWQTLDAQLIGKNTCEKALMECAVKADFRGSGVTIPLEIVAAEVEARWPGRWPTEFEENSRGPRFWDESGDAMSVIVKPEGLVCYTGDVPFYDWRRLLGDKFVSKYVDDRIGGAASCAWFDGKDFWVQNPDNESWRIIAREDLARKLRVEFGMSAVVDKGETASEVDKTLHSITVTRMVKSAVPFVNRRPGIILVKGERHLNPLSLAPCLPADTMGDPETDWPWIHNFLMHAFEGDTPTKALTNGRSLTSVVVVQEHEQLFRFLAWLKRAYVGALEYNPQQGQVLVLAGETGCGKTLLADAFVGDILGGFKDACRYLLGSTHFNKKIFETPLMTINDSIAAADIKTQAQYNSLVKRVAANRTFEHEGKGKDAQDVLWQGRLIITCNVDPESLRMMPQLDLSMEDKVLALRMWDGEGLSKSEIAELKRFGQWEGRTPNENISRELPWFLSWLLAWEVPDWITRDARFGYGAWCHPKLREQADSVGMGSAFNEVLELYLNFYFLGDKKLQEWSGSASKLLADFRADNSPVRAITQNYNPIQMGRSLSSLIARGSIVKSEAKCQKCFKQTGAPYYVFAREFWVE